MQRRWQFRRAMKRLISRSVASQTGGCRMKEVASGRLQSRGAGRTESPQSWVRNSGVRCRPQPGMHGRARIGSAAASLLATVNLSVSVFVHLRLGTLQAAIQRKAVSHSTCTVRVHLRLPPTRQKMDPLTSPAAGWRASRWGFGRLLPQAPGGGDAGMAGALVLPFT